MGRALLIGCLLVLACAGDEGATTATAPASVPFAAQAPVLARGDAHVYRVQWDTEAAREHDAGGLDLAGGLHVGGSLVLARVGDHEDGMLVAAWFSELPTARIVANDQTSEIDGTLLVGPRAYFVVAPDGAAVRAFYPADSAGIFREVMSGVLARMDLRAAAASGSPHTIRIGSGLAEVAYRKDGAGTVHRELQSLARFDIAPGVAADAPTVSGTAELAIDADGMPASIASEESAALAEDGTLAAHERFTAVRDRVDRVELVTPDLAALVAVDLLAPPDLAASDRELARQRAGDLTLQDVGIAVQTLDGGVMPRPGFVSRAQGWLRGWPENADALVPVFADAGFHGRQLVFDMLSSAGTPESQRVMARIVGDDAAPEWEETPLLVQRYAFVREPDAATGAFLLELEARATADGHARLAQALLHPMGTVAWRLGATEPLVAERLHARIVAQLAHEDGKMRGAAIAGLGNARRPSDADLIVARLGDPDVGMRIEAVSALRAIVTPATTEAVKLALADPDDAVVARAREVLERHLDEERNPPRG
jgi:hypothetical protein